MSLRAYLDGPTSYRPTCRRFGGYGAVRALLDPNHEEGDGEDFDFAPFREIVSQVCLPNANKEKIKKQREDFGLLMRVFTAAGIYTDLDRFLQELHVLLRQPNTLERVYGGDDDDDGGTMVAARRLVEGLRDRGVGLPRAEILTDDEKTLYWH